MHLCGIQGRFTHKTFALQIACAFQAGPGVAHFGIGLADLRLAFLHTGCYLPVIDNNQHLSSTNFVACFHGKTGNPPGRLRGDGALLDRLDHTIEFIKRSGGFFPDNRDRH